MGKLWIIWSELVVAGYPAMIFVVDPLETFVSGVPQDGEVLDDNTNEGVSFDQEGELQQFGLNSLVEDIKKIHEI